MANIQSNFKPEVSSNTEQVHSSIEDILALRVDGRPLYRYRLKHSEFLNLQSYLKSNHLSFYNTEKVTKFSQGLDRLFVLYASEWWRREYNGNWGWSDLLSSINIKHSDISNQDLLKITESGLAKWDREISRTALNHRSAMGSFLREGGLPINYFNASGGWLDLLYGAMKVKAQNGDALLYFNNYINRLPKTSGIDDIIDTLVALVDDIHNLVITHGLDSQPKPIEHLDKTTDGNWIDSFPFSLEDESARELLKSLVLDSVKTVKNKANTQPLDDDWLHSIQLKRTLDIRLDKPAVTLSSKIAAPKFLSLNGNADKITDEDIGILFYDQERDSVIGKWEASPIHSQDRMILRAPRNINIDNALWSTSITLQLTDSLGKLIKGLTDKQNNPINPYQNSSMSEVDTEIPFLASIQRESDISIVAEYEGSYNQSVKDDCAIIFIPDNWQYNLDPNSELSLVAKISESGLAGLIYKLEGKVIVTGGNQRYIFKTRSQDANYQYEISGRQLVDFTYPSKVIKGEITVTAISKEDSQIRSTVQKHRIWLAPILDHQGHIGSYKTLDQLRRTPSGCYRLQVRDNEHNVLFSTHIGLVPHDFRYRLQPLNSDSNEAIGNINIECNEPAKLEAYSPYNLSCKTVNVSGNKFSLSIDKVPSEKVTLSLSFVTSHPGQAIAQPSTRPLRFQCYFPSSQTVIYNQQMGELDTMLHLNIDDNLNGYRIKVFNPRRPREATVEFRLSSQRNQILSTTYAVDANKFLELKPVDWLPTIKRLLSLSEQGLDDKVFVTLRFNNSEPFNITFGYYHYQLYANNDEKLIELRSRGRYSIPSAQELSQLQELYAHTDLQAFNFSDPEDVFTLSKIQSLSEESPFVWTVTDLEGAPEGTYLVYSMAPQAQEGEETAPTLNEFIRSTVYQVTKPTQDQEDSVELPQPLEAELPHPEPNQNYDLFANLEGESKEEQPSQQQDLEDNSPATMTLANASKIGNPYARLKAIRKVYRQMAFDLDHPDWQYLKVVTTNCIHLPLVTLDNWLAARQVPEFMCAVAIYGNAEFVLTPDIVKKVRDEIGFIWSLVTYEDFARIYNIAKNKVSTGILALPLSEDMLESTLSQVLIDLQNKIKDLSPLFENWFNQSGIGQGHTQRQVSGAMTHFLGELIKQKQLFNAIWPDNPELTDSINKVIQDVDEACLLQFNIPSEYMRSTALLPLAMAWLSSQPSHMTVYTDWQNEDKDMMRLGRLKNLRKDMRRQNIAIYEIMKFAPNWYQLAFDMAFSWFHHCHKENE